MQCGHAYSPSVRVHILTNLVLSSIILNKVDFTEQERTKMENMLRESEGFLMFAMENETLQTLRAKFKI